MQLAIISGAEMVSGKEIVALELGEGLRKLGHGVEYITGRVGNGDFRERLNSSGFRWEAMDMAFISASLRLRHLKLTAAQMLRMPGLWSDYRRFLLRDRPDQVIHSSWHHALLLWPFLAPGRDWLWLHEVLPDKPQYHRVFQRLARRLRGFVGVSSAVTDAVARLGVPSGQIHVIHNGLSDIAHPDRKPQTRVSGSHVGVVGQVAEWKGLLDLLEALPLVVAQHPDVHLHVYGLPRNDHEKLLQKRAADLGVAANVTWHGFVMDRACIYSDLDICVVPSREPDPLPTVAIEAALFGLPVVATRCGGLPEIVDDGTTGYLVDPRSKDQIAARLIELMADASLRQRMGAAARSLAVEHFNQQRFASDFARLLGPE